MTFNQKKYALIALAGCIAVAGIVTATVCLLRSTPEPPKVTPDNADNVVKFMASDNFVKLDSEKKKEYFDKMRDNPEMRNAMFAQRDNLSEQQRQNLRRNMGNAFRQQMRERMNKYFALKTREEKNKMLDEMIDEMQKHRAEMEKHREEFDKRRAEMEKQRKENGNKPQGDQTKSRRQHMREHMEQTSPQDRAQFHQFMSDMAARAKERGVSLPGPPRGR